MKGLEKILNIGLDEQKSPLEKKKVRILNFASFFIGITIVFFFLLDFYQGILTRQIFISFILQIIFLISIVYFQYVKKWNAARFLFILFFSATLFVNNNLNFRGYYGEYMYLGIPLLCMLFFEKKWIYIVSLILSIALFYLPNHLLEIYPEAYFGYLNTFILFLGTFSLVYFFRALNIKNEEELNEVNRKLDKAYTELQISKKNELAVSSLKALQSQMNPHFIFNALNSVQDLVLLKDIRNSNKFLGKFSDLLRKILLSSKEQFISLEEEIEILGLYLDIEKLRFGDEFIIDFSCDVPLEKQVEIQLPAMFIQPYIENAIKHGLFNKKGEKKLVVSFKITNQQRLECIIQDNGIGQKQAAVLKEQRLHLHTGFSTEAINERIQLLNQTLEKKIDIQIIDLEENGQALGTKILLHFPV